MDNRAKRRAYRKVLNDEIKSKHRQVNRLKESYNNKESLLSEASSWMKRLIIKNAIKGTTNSVALQTKRRHEKKFNNLLEEKRKKDGITKNPNQCVINLTGSNLTEEQYGALQFGLKYGIATNPKENDLIASAESLWEQLEKKDLLVKDHNKIQRAKNSLRGLVFNFLNFHDRRIVEDNKKTKIIKELCENNVILQPDKGGGVVLMKKSDYVDKIEHLFSDRQKFKTIPTDPTPTRLNSLQRYLKKLEKREEITEEIYKKIRPMNAQPARAHGLPKTHKEYEDLPPFRPVIDTIGSTHYKVGKHLCEILKPLSTNEYTLKDSFDAAERIRNIPETAKNDGYKFVSFDVVSLFTNVPLKRTLDIILNRVYKDKLIQTTLKKSTLKKLILDTCTKTAFLFNGKLYEQKDGVSMGGSLGPLLANVIMTELEKKVVKPLIDDGTIRFYTRFVDDTLLLVKDEDIDLLKNKFERFDKNLRFTYDKFENENPHFLDIEIATNGLKIYRKDTFTGHYTDFNSFVPWNFRVSWMRSLVYRTKKLCDRANFKEGIEDIKKFAAWNGFPRYIRTKLIDKFITTSDLQRTEKEDDPDEIPVYLNLPYIGSTGDHLVKSFRKKIRKFLDPTKKVNIKIFTKTTQIRNFTSTKDKVPVLSKSNVVYKIECPGCGADYIGKTDRTINERTKEHATSDKESPMRSHLQSCAHFQHMHEILTISDNLFDDNITENKVEPSFQKFATEAIQRGVKVLDNDSNWNQLLYKEALWIERNHPTLNTGLKASRQLKLFR